MDGTRLAAGPVSGDPRAWPFHSYTLALPPGRHALRADVWWLPPAEAPAHRMTLRGGFICAAEGDAHSALSTGHAPWRVRRLRGWRIGPGLGVGVHSLGGSLERDLRIEPEPAVPAKAFELWWDGLYGFVNSGWQLAPAGIPDPRETLLTAGRWAARIDGPLPPERPVAVAEIIPPDSAAARLPTPAEPLAIGPESEVNLVLDLETYACGTPEIVVAGGRDAFIECLWAESLFPPGEATRTKPAKGSRDLVAGRCFFGFGDAWTLAGADEPTTLPAPHWWRAGRYLLLRIRTRDEGLRLHSVRVRTTGYPWPESAPAVATPDPALAAIFRLAWRGFTACTHDAFMDCPYYEQLMYVADARVMMLVSYAATGDDRLARRGIELFDLSRRHHGLPAMRYPSQQEMVSPTFALWWIAMVNDFAHWRRDRAWVRTRLPGVRATLEEIARSENAEGLLERLPGWPFVDWGTPWDDPAHPEHFNGVPAQARSGVSSIYNLHYLFALRQAADLETYAGVPAFAAHYQERADTLRAACRRFIDADTGLVRDTLDAAPMSEHAQALALLAGLFDPTETARPLAALAEPCLPACASTYFLHHVFQCLAAGGRGEAILPRLGPWRDMLALGLHTPLEEPEPSRSDCHGWGSHPLFHYVTGILGLQPEGFEFRTFTLRPALGTLPWAEATVPHPDGPLKVRVEQREGRVRRVVLEIPAPLTGTLILGTEHIALKPGAHTLDF